MSYQVKEIYLTLQGEGGQAGRAAVFLRFTGCNLWTGLEKDRDKAKCYFCDTDFVGVDGENGGKFETSEKLSARVLSLWPGGEEKLVVLTGGEPLLQLDKALIESLKQDGFRIAVETNGTISAPEGIDWLTVSPKPNSELVQKNGQELKLVFPSEVKPEDVESLDFENFYLSPMDELDSVKNKENLKAATKYCLANPKWKLTVQLHKLIGIK